MFVLIKKHLNQNGEEKEFDITIMGINNYYYLGSGVKK